ncbi:hypothetical protein [Acidithiobacillus acidisediminis]|uniref:hypothetical protein n=1 Tax=Acidithiobacillus acidisediminis TaxID=2937799 RepID=UPI0020102E8E|nr:hypothetical protein [Acidithiobacillus sp. S30A2]
MCRIENFPGNLVAAARDSVGDEPIMHLREYCDQDSFEYLVADLESASGRTAFSATIAAVPMSSGFQGKVYSESIPVVSSMLDAYSIAGLFSRDLGSILDFPMHGVEF